MEDKNNKKIPHGVTSKRAALYFIQRQASMNECKSAFIMHINVGSNR
jgi:hypothetical protein